MARQREIDSFSLLCDTLDLLLCDTLPNIPHKHLQLDKGCIVVSTLMATNGKFTLYLYNERFDTLVDQNQVSDLTQLFDQLCTWGDY